MNHFLDNINVETNRAWVLAKLAGIEHIKGPFGLSLLLLKLKVAEIENWKHCSKIIFKCVNNAVGPIFNEKVVEKWYLWVREQ